jgi:hypothetical protein
VLSKQDAKSSCFLIGFGKGEAFGRDASGQVVKYFAECFAPTDVN